MRRRPASWAFRSNADRGDLANEVLAQKANLRAPARHGGAWLNNKQREHGPDESGDVGQRSVWSRWGRHVGNVWNQWRWECPVRCGRHLGVRDTGDVRQFG